MKKILLRIDEASDMLSVHPATIRRLLADGTLAGVKVRGCVRVIASSLDAYVLDQHQKYSREMGFSVAGMCTEQQVF